MVHDVFNNIHTLINDEKYTNYKKNQIVEEAIKMTMKDVAANEGLWRQVDQTEEGAVFGQQDFIHFMYDYKGTHLNNTFAGEPELTTALNRSGDYNTFKDKHMGKNTTYARVLDRDTIKAAAIDVQNGSFFRYPDRVNEIADKYNVDRYKVMNDILESEGFKQRLGPDTKAMLEAINVPNINYYNDSNLASIGAYFELANELGEAPVDKEYGILKNFNWDFEAAAKGLNLEWNTRDYIKLERRYSWK